MKGKGLFRPQCFDTLAAQAAQHEGVGEVGAARSASFVPVLGPGREFGYEGPPQVDACGRTCFDGSHKGGPLRKAQKDGD